MESDKENTKRTNEDLPSKIPTPEPPKKKVKKNPNTDGVPGKVASRKKPLQTSENNSKPTHYYLYVSLHTINVFGQWLPSCAVNPQTSCNQRTVSTATVNELSDSESPYQRMITLMRTPIDYDSD